MHIVKRIFRYFLLLLLGICVAVLWIYCHGFLPNEFISRGALATTAERFGGIATLLVLSVIPALPIYKLYPHHSAVAAASIGWVPLILSVTLAYQVDLVIAKPFAISLAAAEGVACWVAIVFGAWTAGRFFALDTQTLP
jgi:hypothetical protein